MKISKKYIWKLFPEAYFQAENKILLNFWDLKINGRISNRILFSEISKSWVNFPNWAFFKKYYFLIYFKYFKGRKFPHISSTQNENPEII